MNLHKPATHISKHFGKPFVVIFSCKLFIKKTVLSVVQPNATKAVFALQTAVAKVTTLAVLKILRVETLVTPKTRYTFIAFFALESLEAVGWLSSH